MPKKWPGSGKRCSDPQICREMPRQTPLFIYVEKQREILGDPFYTHPHLPKPALTHPYRAGDNPVAR